RLDGLLACSDTTLLRTRRAMIEATGTWGDAQDAILARTMAPKDILVGADENFHDAMMLVAMEPVSGFVLVEQGADRRDGETWTKTLRGALAKWPVRLVALVGDEAKGLLHCAMTGLGVPKVSDVFHVLHTLCGGTAGALAQQVRGAQTALDTARAELDVADAVRTATAARSESELYQRLGGMLRAFDKVTAAHKTLALVEANCEAVRAAVRDLSDRYHPVDLVTGALLSPTAVAARLREGFTTLRTRVREAGVATHTRVAKALTKAERVLPSLTGWVQTWHRLVEARIVALELSAPETAWVWTVLLPALYFDHIVAQGADAATRAQRRERRDALLLQIDAADSPWQAWHAATRTRVYACVRDCVELFVRTSSYVEGRNGQLALSHHRTHHLAPALLKALTVVHNYVLTRPDGTTAAERFTGHKHGDLFQHLVATLPLPARPRIRKPKERPPLLATG